jgi:hypothetical protein
MDQVDVSGRASRRRGLWKRSVIETKVNIINLTAWVHKECEVMNEDALTRLQEAWVNSEQKDNAQCIWMIWSKITEWALTLDSREDMGFKEQYSVLIDRAKTGRWDQGAVNS